MDDLLVEINHLIEQELEKQDFICPKDHVTDDEEVIGRLNEKEIAILSALLRTQDKLQCLKLKMMSPDHPYNPKKIEFYNSIISGLESTLINSLLDRFIKKTNYKSSYKIKKDWQVAINTS